jgi:virulence factor
VDATGTTPLRVAVVGIGDIARKAYLPVLTGLGDVELTLCTRDEATLAALGDRYGVRRRTTRVQDLLDGSVDAALVHAATPAHAELVQALLTAGVPVLVDKPLAPDLATSTRLVDLAEERGVSLTVGFNRRFAPAHVPLAGLPASVVLVQKHRTGLPEEPRRFVLDDFVHVVDTLRFLLPAGQEEVSVWCTAQDGLLATVTLALRVGSATGLGVMHRVGGVTEEVVQVLGPGFQHRVVDLAEVWRGDDPTGERLLRRDGWTDVPTVRGFTAMVETFLASVRAGQVLSARDALRTHEICEQVVAAAEAELSR